MNISVITTDIIIVKFIYHDMPLDVIWIESVYIPCFTATTQVITKFKTPLPPSLKLIGSLFFKLYGKEKPS